MESTTSIGIRQYRINRFEVIDQGDTWDVTFVVMFELLNGQRMMVEFSSNGITGSPFKLNSEINQLTRTLLAHLDLIVEEQYLDIN